MDRVWIYPFVKTPERPELASSNKPKRIGPILLSTFKHPKPAGLNILKRFALDFEHSDYSQMKITVLHD